MVVLLLEKRVGNVGRSRIKNISLYRRMSGQGNGHLLHAVFTIRQGTCAHLVNLNKSF